MARTNVKGTQVLDGSVGRADLNTTVSGSAVITKLIAGNGVAISTSTGADSGTGDVTVAADLTFLDTKYPSITASRTQNYVLAAPSSGSGAATFRALVAGDIPAIAISGITSLQAALDGKIYKPSTHIEGKFLKSKSITFDTPQIWTDIIISDVVGLESALGAKLSGSGESGYLAKYTGLFTQENSVLFESSCNIGLGTITPTSKLSFATFWNSSAETIGINLAQGQTTLLSGLPAYGIGFGPSSTEGYVNYRSGTSSAANFGHKWFVNDSEVMRVNGLGSWGVGTASLGGYNGRMVRDFNTSTSYGLSSEGIAQLASATVTNFNSIIGTGADANPSTIRHFMAQQSASWSGFATTQIAFYVSSNLTGSTNTYGFRSDLAAGSGLWNIYTGTAPSFFGGSVGIGATSLSNVNFSILKTITGGTTSMGVLINGQVQSDVTGAAYYFRSGAGVQDSPFILPDLYHYAALQSTFGASATVTRQAGLYVGNLTGGVTNYAVRTQVMAGTNNWNIFADGTANNHFAGKVAIGTTTVTQANVPITLSLTGNANYYGVSYSGIVQSDVTTAVYFKTNAGNTSGSNTSNLVHFGAYRGTLSGSVVNQFGFYVDGTLVGGTNANYAFYSGIASGATNWGFYSAGTANNHFNGNVWIGTVSGGSNKLDVSGISHFSGNATFDANVIIATAPTAGNHATNKTYVDSLTFLKRGDTVKTIALADITRANTQTINGVSLIAGDLVLLAGQTTPSQNGVYVVVSGGAWTRSTTNDSDSEIRQAYHLITNGTYENQRYINTNTSTITVGTTSLTYTLDFGAELDPIWSAFQTTYDISPTRIGQWNSAYSFATGLTTTNNLIEGGTNLYFTTARVLATALTGYTVGTNTAVTATDTILQAFQKLQGQVNNRLILGGNASGAAIIIGTNDNFDFSLERNNATQITLKSTGPEFATDVDFKGKLKLNTNAGLDHQFIKYNGSSNEWAYLNTGELQDKNNLIMLEDIAGERGFQMFSDSAKTYADAFVFTNSITGVVLGLHGYAADANDAIKEFGMQLSADGNLYHKKLDGTRSRIATVDMLSSGGNAAWNGGAVANDILLPIDKAVIWQNHEAWIEYESRPWIVGQPKMLYVGCSNDIYIGSNASITIGANKICFQRDPYAAVEIDFNSLHSLPDGQYVRGQMSTSGGIRKLTFVSD